MFALVVFVSDGLLQIKDTTPPAARFFRIASQLPLELQKVLCFRQVGSTKAKASLPFARSKRKKKKVILDFSFDFFIYKRDRKKKKEES